MYPLSIKKYCKQILFIEIFTFILSLIRCSHSHCVDKTQGFVMLKQVVRFATRVAEMLLKWGIACYVTAQWRDSQNDIVVNRTELF
jgi:hypothetical protein